MKIRTNRETLAAELSWVSQAVPRGGQSPELTGIRLDATDDLTVTGYNFDTGHRASVSAEVIDAGSALVPAAFLRDLVASMAGEDIEITADEVGITIASGRASYRTSALRLREYPTVPEPPATIGTTTVAAFADALGAISHIIEDASQYPQFRGLRLAAKGDRLDLVGTDGKRIGRASIPWHGAEFEETIPSKAATVAIKGLAGTLAIGQHDGLLSLADANHAVTSRTIADEYIDWRSALGKFPPEFGLTAPIAELVAAMKRTKVLAEEGGRVVLDITEDSISLSMSNAQVGDGSDLVDCDSERCLRVAFQPQYLLDTLSNLPGETVHIGLSDHRKPAHITSTHPGPAFMVMPIALPASHPGGTR